MTSSSSPLPTIRAALGCLARIGCGALVLAFVGAVWLYWSFTSSWHDPRAVAVPSSWTSRAVTLTAEHPAIHGHVAFALPGQGSKPFALGVNAGVPTTTVSSTPGPADLLAVPAVRLTAKGANGAVQSCLAPCELSLGTGSACAGTCNAEFDLTVELLASTSGRGPVVVTVTGGASASVGGDKPGVEFTMDGATVSGGG